MFLYLLEVLPAIGHLEKKETYSGMFTKFHQCHCGQHIDVRVDGCFIRE